jgi:hypothetical protein
MDRLFAHFIGLYSAVVLPAADDYDRQRVEEGGASARARADVVLQMRPDSTAAHADAALDAAMSLLDDFWVAATEIVASSSVAGWVQTILARSAAARQAVARRVARTAHETEVGMDQNQA